MNRSRTESWAGAVLPARRLTSAALALRAVAIWPGVAHARKLAISHQTSANWAGYAVIASMPLRYVSGQWTAPAPVCHQPSSTYSAFWVGLIGFKRSSQSLEQIGSEADCAPDERPDTYAWYELLPAPPVKLELPVRPGDLLFASVSVHGPGCMTALSASGQASPSDPTDRGGTFTVTYRQRASPVPPVPFAAFYRLRHTARVRVNRTLQAEGPA
jgi:Peptidase A4 family